MPIKAPWHLWLVGIGAVLFNFIGVFDFVMARIQGTAYLESAGMTAAQIAFYQAFPTWMMAVWAIGVFAAFLASILLLMRRRLASPLFWLSLAAFALNSLYIYVLTDGGTIMGSQMAITSAVIAVLLLLFALYAGWMTRRGVNR